MTARYGVCCRSNLSPRLPEVPHGVLRFLLAATFFYAQLAPTASASAASLEYEVKAAFILNFTKFVEWPASAFATPNAPFAICILGNDPFGRVVDQIVEGESVNGHKIVVERIQADSQKSCQVLYFGDPKPNPAVLNAASAGVLTIGEGSDFIHEGGIIGFVLDNRHVRFDINLKAATNADLKLSSKLLAVARSVEK